MIVILYGLFFPYSSGGWGFQILERINNSLMNMDSGRLLLSAFSYVCRSSITFIFVYIGAILAATQMTRLWNKCRFSYAFIFLTLAQVISLNILYKEHYAYVPHFLALALLLLYRVYIPRQKYFYLSFSVLTTFTIIAFQCLNLINGLTTFHFGTDDLAISLKLTDRFLSQNELLTTLFLALFMVMVIISIIYTILISLYNKQLTTFKQYQKQELELKRTRFALIESKVYQEIHSLVHDLKTPLVSVEGLLSLIQMKYPYEKDPKLKDYLDRVDGSIQKMSDMISEILYEDIKRNISVSELMNYVTSHLALDEQLIDMNIELESDLPPIRVNKIRFSRAISNLLENSIVSFQGKKGKIRITISSHLTGVLFEIWDNGSGINQQDLQTIWEEGFSTKDSTGLGLTFVKRVVDHHDGSIAVSSTLGSHTKIDIYIPSQGGNRHDSSRGG
ncbi:HAMP domain-containing histidine kinase [Radiobacillus kanasensis]|uniref:sensor histidine kinase n=1 Tax=Radiobacillus kanasensis TaxID=2844358 RepID=UPI001E48A9EA|nr:HAMP domain-containing sensor histidine kinase [Radiobacillus kanasensis]UFT98494.1 HAMP domain-containing histidine kinase [Radiobacillus kanasensis]